MTDLQTSRHKYMREKNPNICEKQKDLASLSSSQQLDTTVVLVYVCSLFIRRKLITLKQKRKEYTIDSLLPSPLLSLVVDADTVERGGGEPTSHCMWHVIIIVVVVYLL